MLELARQQEQDYACRKLPAVGSDTEPLICTSIALCAACISPLLQLLSNQRGGVIPGPSPIRPLKLPWHL